MYIFVCNKEAEGHNNFIFLEPSCGKIKGTSIVSTVTFETILCMKEAVHLPLLTFQVCHKFHLPNWKC